MITASTRSKSASNVAVMFAMWTFDGHEGSSGEKSIPPDGLRVNSYSMMPPCYAATAAARGLMTYSFSTLSVPSTSVSATS